MPRGMPERRRRGTSLATQVTVAGVGFGLLVAVVFGLLVHAVREQRDATRRTTAATDIVAAGNRLERLVIDTETGQRGFVISGDPRFLAPLDQARAQIPDDFARLRRLAAEDAATTRRLAELERAVAAYLRDWSDRVVAVARVDRPRARRLVSGGEGKRRVDALRSRFDALLGDRRLAAAAQAARASDRAQTATILGIAGIVGSVLVFAVFATYVVRAILAPVRRTAGTAERIARGDFGARVKGADHAQAELGSMVRGFNAMADALQDGHEELESGRARLELQNHELEAQRRELESVVRQLEDEKRRIAEAQAFGEAVAAESRFAPLADLILARVADAVGADVGAIFARDARRDDALAPAVTRGLRREDLPERLEPGVGFAGRAAAERRTVTADFSESRAAGPRVRPASHRPPRAPRPARAERPGLRRAQPGPADGRPVVAGRAGARRAPRRPGRHRAGQGRGTAREPVAAGPDPRRPGRDARRDRALRRRPPARGRQRAAARRRGAARRGRRRDGPRRPGAVARRARPARRPRPGPLRRAARPGRRRGRRHARGPARRHRRARGRAPQGRVLRPRLPRAAHAADLRHRLPRAAARGAVRGR